MPYSFKKFTALLYAYKFVGNCMVIYPFYAIMFAERSHLSTAQISVLFAWWCFVALVSEIPTGTLADRFSRRGSLIAGPILQIAAFGTWVLWPSFYGYAVGFTLWGISYALESGAFQAYLYDKLHDMGREGHFAKLYTRSESLYLLGMLAAYVAASMIGKQYTALLYGSIAVTTLSVLLACMLPKETKSAEKPPSQIHLLKAAIAEVRASRLLVRFVITLGVVSVLTNSIEEYVPLYYDLVGASGAAIPLLLALGLALSAALSWSAHLFENRRVLFGLLLSATGGLVLFATSFQGTVLAIAGMMIFMRLVSLATLLYESAMQHHVQKQSRATVSSLPSFLEEVLSLFVLLGYGAIAHLSDDITPIRVVGLGTVLAALLLAIYWRDHYGTRLSADSNLVDLGTMNAKGVEA